jgi:hypothetical protein
MILSHDKKFLFIHVPKTAGTNVRNWLLSQTENKENFWWWDKSGTDRAHLHCNNISKYIDVSKIQYEQYYIFGFVRNPYHRIYSAFKEVKWKGPCKDHSFESILRLFLAKQRINELPVHFQPQVKFLKYATQVYKYELLYESVGNISTYLKIEPLKLSFEKKTHSYTYFEHYSQAMIDIINITYAEDFEKYGYYKIPERISKFRFPSGIHEDYLMQFKEINSDINKIEGYKCRSIFQEIKLCIVAMRRHNSLEHGNRLYDIISNNWDSLKYYLNNKWIISICETFIDLNKDEKLSLYCTTLVSTFLLEKAALSNLQKSYNHEQLRLKEDSPLYSGLWHYNCKSGDMLQNKLKRLCKVMKKNALMFSIFKTLYINSIIHDNAGLNTAFTNANESGKVVNILTQ